MGLGNAFILLVTWLTFVTVSPFPTDLTDNIFYNADLSTPVTSSDTVDELIPNAPPRLDGTDDGLTVRPLSSMELVGNEMADGDQLSVYAESIMDSLDGLTEPVDTALAAISNSIASNPAGCAVRPSRRRARSDMALGISTCLQRLLC